MLKSLRNNPQNKTVPCSSCGGVMVLRPNGRFGPFYGCSKFPSCRHTLKVEAVQAAEKEANKPNISSSFIPNQEQKDILSWVLGSRKSAHLMIQACAGSGKTTTIEWLIRQLDEMLKMAYLVFGSDNAKEAVKRMPLHVLVKTTHSFSLSIIKSHLNSNVKIDPNKAASILFKILPDGRKKETRAKFASVKWVISPTLSLVSNLKNEFLEPTDENIRLMMDRYNVTLPDEQKENIVYLYTKVRETFKKSIEDLTTVDYDDMLFIPLYYDMDFPTLDYVFSDEQQDYNECQIRMILRLVEKGATAINVGDPYQSIYGFRGAKIGAMDYLGALLEADTLPLSVTWRVPKIGVTQINKKFPHIGFNAAPKAIEGEIFYEPNSSCLLTAPSDSLVMCRNNAPLIKVALDLIRDGRKVSVVGRDLMVGLKKLFKDNQKATLADTLKEMGKSVKETTATLRKRNRLMAVESLQDRYKTCVVVAETCVTVNDVYEKLDMLFSDKLGAILCSTIHRAKGMQAKDTYILAVSLIPSVYATTPEQLAQEDNILYVGLTRFSKTLTFIKSVDKH